MLKSRQGKQSACNGPEAAPWMQRRDQVGDVVSSDAGLTPGRRKGETGMDAEIHCITAEQRVSSGYRVKRRPSPNTVAQHPAFAFLSLGSCTEHIKPVPCRN